MDVSFFQDWVTFYPPDKPPLTMKAARALRLIHASLTEEGITIIQSVPLGSGAETVLYRLSIDSNVFEEIITLHAKKIVQHHFMYEELKLKV